VDEPLDLWFKREVVIHEEALTRYLRRCWVSPDDIHDLRQETYIRVYESARKNIPIQARPFIFAIAKNLMADRIRKQRIVPIDTVGDLEALNVLVDDLNPEQRTSAHQELRQLAKAIDDLPEKCRTVLWMRRIDDLPQKEVATRLGLSEKTVEKHVMKGIKRLTDAVFGGAPDRKPQASDQNQGGTHGKQQTD
jgi:RNA polymerase sigma-70 factor (ECF subfamily)